MEFMIVLAICCDDRCCKSSIFESKFTLNSVN